ncbi:hypothetical protein OK351_05190 [Glutamicibacter sp. MNS18]|uniref:hypothetical protein n=1 Tax=Glutamicibacter sp. MNS18 TaxID=2989817 RepID=UPI0022360DF0|nr:hypothetical protein [Glutamicibacter sp. MNS18]MCW4464901.1 hypothetical protein [Glutamicibacter sp. MNS18]
MRQKKQDLQELVNHGRNRVLRAACAVGLLVGLCTAMVFFLLGYLPDTPLREELYTLRYRLAFALRQEGLAVVSVLAAIAIAAAVAVSDSAKRMGEIESGLRENRRSGRQPLRVLVSLAGLERITTLEYCFAVGMAVVTAGIAVIGVINRLNPLVIATSGLLCLFICIEAVRISALRQDGIRLSNLTPSWVVRDQLEQLRTTRLGEGPAGNRSRLMLRSAQLGPLILVSAHALVLGADLLLPPVLSAGQLILAAGAVGGVLPYAATVPVSMTGAGSGFETMFMYLVLTGCAMGFEQYFARPSLYDTLRKRRVENAFYLVIFLVVLVLVPLASFGALVDTRSVWTQNAGVVLLVLFLLLLLLRYLGQRGIGCFRILAQLYLSEAEGAFSGGELHQKEAGGKKLRTWFARQGCRAFFSLFPVLLPTLVALGANAWPVALLLMVFGVCLELLWRSLRAKELELQRHVVPRSTPQPAAGPIALARESAPLAVVAGLLMTLCWFLWIFGGTVNPASRAVLGIMLPLWLAGVLGGHLLMYVTDLDGAAAVLRDARRRDLERSLGRGWRRQAKVHRMYLAPFEQNEPLTLSRRGPGPTRRRLLAGGQRRFASLT